MNVECCLNLRTLFFLFCFDLFPLILSEIFHGSEKQHLGEGNQLAEDQPDVDHLDVGCGWQALHLAEKDGGHHQHGGQVHAQCCLKEERFEERGCKSDCHEKNGGGIGRHHFARDLPLEPYRRFEAGHSVIDIVQSNNDDGELCWLSV